MTPVKIVGIVLIVLGAAALAWGGFSYTKEKQQARIGPIELSVSEKQDVSIPRWIGLGVLALGVVLLAVPGKRK